MGHTWGGWREQLAEHIRASDIRGIGRLVITATTGITDLVEAMHHTVNPLSPPDPALRTHGVTGAVFRGVRGVIKVVGGALDLALSPLASLEQAQESSPEREAVVAALNGVLGDHLQATHNPLAIDMALHSHASEDAPVTGKVAVLVPGLCMSHRQWLRNGHDHGAALARDQGYTALYLHYNSGLHISTNGRALAEILEQTLAGWPRPVEQLVIIGHSMGGLVTRSACHVAASSGHAWPRHLSKIVFLGTPHHGAPLERGGNWFNLILGATPYAAPFARLGHVRSAGITDLRYGYLLDDEWADVDRFAHTPDTRRPLPLPAGVQCFVMAATRGKRGVSEPLLGAGPGDGIVPLASALGHHSRPDLRLAVPESQQWIGHGMNHLDLLSRPEVYAQLQDWLA